MIKSWFKSMSIIIMQQSLPSHLQTHSAMCISLSSPCFLRLLHKTTPFSQNPLSDLLLFIIWVRSNTRSSRSLPCVSPLAGCVMVPLVSSQHILCLLCDCTFYILLESSQSCLPFPCCFLESGNPSSSPPHQQLSRVVLCSVVATN